GTDGVAITYSRPDANTLVASDPGRTVTTQYAPLSGNWFNLDVQKRPIVQVSDGAGVVVSHLFDTAGRMTSETNGANETTTFTYGTNGEITSTTDPTGVVRQYSNYGTHGHAQTMTVSGQSTTFSYDAVGNLTAPGVADATTGGVSGYEYDI